MKIREKIQKVSPTLSNYLSKRDQAQKNQLPKHLRPLPVWPIFIEIAFNLGIIVTLIYMLIFQEDFLTAAAPGLALVVCSLLMIHTFVTAFKLRNRYRTIRGSGWSKLNFGLMWFALFMIPVSIANFLP